jgi:hypothetical protein
MSILLTFLKERNVEINAANKGTNMTIIKEIGVVLSNE